jgi:hypothetical protein
MGETLETVACPINNETVNNVFWNSLKVNGTALSFANINTVKFGNDMCLWPALSGKWQSTTTIKFHCEVLLSNKIPHALGRLGEI